MDFEYQDGLKYLQSPLACTKDDQTKIPKNFNTWHDQTWEEGIGKLFLKTKIYKNLQQEVLIFI
jgi:hypothetical protein